MKKRNIIWQVAVLCIGLVIGFSSCSDYLSVERFFKDRQSEDKIFKDKKFSEEWLAYCYDRLLDSNLEIARTYFTVFNYADDIIFNEKDDGIEYRKFKFGEYSNGWSWGSYYRCYEGIRQSSILINNIDINEDLTKEEIADMKAQARFLRGYFYWLLLRKYGPVPIIPEPIAIDESYEGMSCPRNSYDEVVDYIDREMVLAAKDLPNERNNLNISRATRGAALATRAKVLLYAASPINNPGGPADGDPSETFTDFVDDAGRLLMSQTYDESRWARAAAAAKDVMDLDYKLYTAPFKNKGNDAYPATITPPDHPIYSKQKFPNGWSDIDPFESYRAVFNGDLYATENPELIFTRGTNSIDQGVQSLVKCQMAKTAGGRNCHGLTAKQCDAYSMADGKPFDMTTFLATYPEGERFVTEQEYKEGKYPQVRTGVWKEYANREPRFYASVAFNGAFWAFSSARDAEYRNKQIWYYRSSVDGRSNGSDEWQPTGIGMMKYVSPKDCNKNDGKIYPKVDICIRYADILLMFAEAMNELTQDHEVSTWDGKAYTIRRDEVAMSKAVSQVRFRAGVPDYEQTVYQDANAFRKQLKRERQVELMGENQRYFDLRRWKDAPVDEADVIYGCNVLMTEEKAERYYDRVRVENLQTVYSRKMYFWPISDEELKNNGQMTQAPGWKYYD